MTCKNHRKPDILYRDLHTPHSLIIDSLFVFFLLPSNFRLKLSKKKGDTTKKSSNAKMNLLLPTGIALAINIKCTHYQTIL